MFAVIKTGGKQYKVAPNDILRIEKIAGEPGDTVALESVLMLETEAGLTLGTPLVEGASVAAEVVEQGRGPKIVVFKKKRRKYHRRRNGHRQDLTVLRVTEILTDGQKPTPTKAKAKAAKAPAPEAKQPESQETESQETESQETGAKPAAAEKAPAKTAAPKKAAAKKVAPKKAAPKKTAAKSEKSDEE